MNLEHNVADAVCDVITHVIHDSGRTVGRIDLDDRLHQTLALDSMDLAVIVVRLHQQLGVDPFRQRRQPVQTVSDLIAAYRESLTSTE